eukprot:1626764-Prymnesium_polylepis.1
MQTSAEVAGASGEGIAWPPNCELDPIRRIPPPIDGTSGGDQVPAPSEADEPLAAWPHCVHDRGIHLWRAVRRALSERSGSKSMTPKA